MRSYWIHNLSILLLVVQHAFGQRAIASLGKTVRNRLSGKSDTFESAGEKQENKHDFFRPYAVIMSTSTLIWIGYYVFLANKTTHPTVDGESFRQFLPVKGGTHCVYSDKIWNCSCSLI
jgi:hypothetical protein